MVRFVYVLLCIAISSFAVQAANAESPSFSDEGEAQSAPTEEFYWLAPTTQNMLYQGVSLDAAIPIELNFYDLKYNPARIDEALAFIHITANLVTDNGDGPALSGRLFRVPNGSLFLAWQADQIPEPNATYRLTITADNEGLWREYNLNPSTFQFTGAPAGNITSYQTVITTTHILPLATLPIIDDIQLLTDSYQTAFLCPEGQTLCDVPFSCYDRIDYQKTYPYIRLDWHDNEENGDQVFLQYLIRTRPFGANFESSMINIREKQHSTDISFLVLPSDFETYDSYCFDLVVRDLRSYAAGQAEAEEQVLTRCVDGSFFVPSPTYESLASQCHPIDNTPQPDADTTPDAADFFDATHQGNPDATDTDTNPDTLPTNPSDETACSCQTFRTARPHHGLLMLCVAALIGGCCFRMRFGRPR